MVGIETFDLQQTKLLAVVVEESEHLGRFVLINLRCHLIQQLKLVNYLDLSPEMRAGSEDERQVKT